MVDNLAVICKKRYRIILVEAMQLCSQDFFRNSIEILRAGN